MSAPGISRRQKGHAKESMPSAQNAGNAHGDEVGVRDIGTQTRQGE